MIDLAVLAVLALAAFVGWRRGTLRMVLAVIGVVGGYIGAIFLYRPLGRIVAQASKLPPMVSYAIGGMVAFFLASLLVKVVSRSLERRLAREQQGGAAPPSASPVTSEAHCSAPAPPRRSG